MPQEPDPALAETAVAVEAGWKPGRDTEKTLRDVLLEIASHPFRFAAAWNWKAALFSALLRGFTFLVLNLRAGHRAGARAGAVEAVYAIFAAGLAGAFTQRVRSARPRWLTALLVWLVAPGLLLIMEAAVHRATGTPRVRVGLAASFVFASFATGFNWFAMSRGAFVTGEGRSFSKDLLLVPRLLWQFLTAPWNRNGGLHQRQP